MVWVLAKIVWTNTHTHTAYTMLSKPHTPHTKMMQVLLTWLLITWHNLWTLNTLKHHAKSFLPNTAIYFSYVSDVWLWVYVNTGPAAYNSQDEGTPSHSRQRVCRQSEHTDKFCRLMAHQTVTMSPDNACSTVQPQKKKMMTQRVAMLKGSDVMRLAQGFSTFF